MRLSLIQRVIVGFSLMSILMLCISGSAYISQVRMDKQLELTASTLTELLDKTNTVLLHLQNANRAVMQHANTTGNTKRAQLRNTFEKEKQIYNDLSSQLSQEFISYPDINQAFQDGHQFANELLRKSEQLLNTQDQRISAKTKAFNELNLFNGEFLFFEQDMADFIAMAEQNDNQSVVWDLQFLLNQGGAAQLYLQKSLAVTDEEGIQRYNNEVTGYLPAINDKAETVKKAMPSLAKDIEFYQNLLNRAIVDPNGLFQQHLRFVSLNAKSEQQLSTMASVMDETSAKLADSVTKTRDLSSMARENATKASNQALLINLVLCIISVGLSIVIATTVVRSIKTPLIAIMGALKSLSNGDLTQRIKTEFHSEMGLVANNINKLNDQLSSLIGQIQTSASTMRSVAEESLARIFHQSTNAEGNTR